MKDRYTECKLEFENFKKLFIFNKLDSTNVKMYEFIEQNSYYPDVIVVSEQVAGRGRRDNNWYSPRGGLWMSVIIPGTISNRDITALNISCGLSFVKACNTIIRDSGESNLQTFIRWPNDIILENKKIGGLLINVKTIGDKKKSIILGVGINVNQKSFPHNLEKSAISLFMVLRKRISRKELLFNILNELDNMILHIKEKGAEKLLSEWKYYSYELGKIIEITTGEGIKKCGKVVGIGKSGELILINNHGEIERIFNGYNLIFIEK